MSWDDLSRGRDDWPPVREVHAYRQKAYEVVRDVILNHPALDKAEVRWTWTGGPGHFPHPARGLRSSPGAVGVCCPSACQWSTVSKATALTGAEQVYRPVALHRSKGCQRAPVLHLAYTCGLLSLGFLFTQVGWDDPAWAIFMGFEHERIHVETSSVLIREVRGGGEASCQ